MHARFTASSRALVLAVTASTLTPLAAAQPQRVGCVWDRHADSPIARFESGTVVADGTLYCFGGFMTQQILATPRVDRYDPQTDTWTQRAAMPEATTHVGLLVEGRNVWSIGGFVGDSPGVATAAVWIHDIDLNSWSPGPALPRPIAGGGAALLGRRLHYFGGVESDRDTTTGDHWVLDLDALQLGWQPLAPMPEPRCHLSGASLGGEVWAIGGQYRHDTNPADTRWVHAYDPQAGTWREGPLLPRPRSHTEPGTFVRGGKLYIAGAREFTSGPQATDGMLELDPSLGVWSTLLMLPHRRHGASVQWIGSRLYIAGGATTGNVVEPDLFSRDWDATLPNPLRINCGGAELPTASAACCWCGDIGYMNGNPVPFNPNSNVLNTDDDDAYDFQRRGDHPTRQDVDYRFPLGDGFFRVTFFLAERATHTAGARVLDLMIEETRVAEDLDLVLDPGFGVALTRSFDVEVTDGALNLTVHAQPGQRALVAALEIERLGPAHFAFECTSAPNSTGSPASIGFVGTTSLLLDELELHAAPVPSNTFGLYIQAEFAATISLAGGTLCVQQPFFRLPVEQAQGQVMRHDLAISSPPTQAQQITAGTTWRFQGWYRDVLLPAGYGLTDAVKFVFTP